jgi:hypothetical protein
MEAPYSPVKKPATTPAGVHCRRRPVAAWGALVSFASEVLMKRLKFPVAIWAHKDEARYYAFPLGAKDRWGADVVPLIDDATWEYKGTLPDGLLVTDVENDDGNRVRCRLGGKLVYTADWALKDAG